VQELPAARVANALREATVDDVEFVEEAVPCHSEIVETKVGCRPVAVRGVSLPNPRQIVYVRATDPRGNYWYVIDWSQLDPTGRPREIVVQSETEAKEAVIAGLKATYVETGGIEEH
jgi:hypothetical protein